ncbi:MAG: hypothetical protein ABI131_12570 [Nostocoides sp.]
MSPVQLDVGMPGAGRPACWLDMAATTAAAICASGPAGQARPVRAAAMAGRRRPGSGTPTTLT